MPALQRLKLMRLTGSIGGLSFNPLRDNIQVQTRIREVRNRTLHKNFIQK